MQAMINYRLRVARDYEIAPSLFSLSGLAAIYLATGGYPRKVVILCHQVVLTMIIRGKNKAGWFFVRSCINDMETPLFKKLKWALGSVFILIAVGLSIGAIMLQRQDADAHKQLSIAPVLPIVPEVKQTASLPNVPGAKIIQKKTQNVKIPGHLGILTMTKRRTLWWTLNNIYGEINPKITKAVIMANPQNKNRIAEGNKIYLPSIPADINPINKGDIIVVVESGKDLEIVYNSFWGNPAQRNMPPLVFFPFWNKKEGINFLIVIDKCFENIRAAEEASGKLPPAVAARAKILSQWDADTVFFNRRKLQH